MSDAKKCDRCGTFYTETEYSGYVDIPCRVPVLSITNPNATRWEVIRMDLCPDCFDYLQKYLHALKKEESK